MNPRFHAHLFFELADTQVAESIHQQLTQTLPAEITIGPLLLRTAGPLPQPMFQLEYSEAFAHQVQTVLESLRKGRSVLIHPLMEDELSAHTKHAVWLGNPLKLNLENL